MLLDSAVAIVWDVLKMAVVPIKRQIGYVISSKSYTQDLQKEVGKLKYEAERIDHAAEGARNNLRKVYSQVMEWQARAEQALKEARDLLAAFEESSKTCCYGTLPDLNCRYQFSRKAKDKIKDIQQLAREGSEFKDISFSDPAPGIVAPQTPAEREGKDVVQSTFGKLRDDGVFESRASIIQDIIDALANNSNSVVGVHGMGGVGKSTLLVDAERRIREKTLFDLVAKADVSANPDIKRIQGEIAHELDLDIKNEEFASVRAKLLWQRLEAEGKKKKVLIILDNLWERLDLKSVGIPCGHDNKVIGCKLLLTSRDKNVLQTDMGCDMDFLLVGLQEEEAKDLFERMAGAKVHDNEFKPLVDEALHKCAGFPFLIIAMAKYLKNARLSDWRDALKQIDMSTNKGISKGINEMLQLSYDHLKGEEGEEAKSFLRLCVACGFSKPALEDLVRYGMSLRLFREDSSMEEARDRLSSLVRTLQASSLLLDDEDANVFKIHDLVRGFVASVSSRDHPFLILKDKDKMETELSKDKLKSCEAICFYYVNLGELPEELDCPELQMFLLFINNKSLEVPNSYFNSMRNLRVLDLTGIRLCRSPSPFQFLENLRTLCLDYCSLDDVASLGELKGLQILSFINSDIHRLPKEIGQLVELKLLDLSHCSQLKIIEPGVLQSLIKLEELYMENSFHQWNDGEQTPPTNASLIELNNMKNLCTLHVSIPNPSLLPKDLNFKQLTKYKIQIGNAQHWSKYKGSRTLDLQLDPRSDILRKGCIQSILHKTDTLFLDGLNDTEQSICTVSQGGFPKLKHLEVHNSPSIQNILRWPYPTAFKALESLILKNLINLEKISNNNISSESFRALKVVQVNNCGKMEILFPLSVVRELPQLEEIEVDSCKLMQGIVEADDCGKFELPKLRVLKLHDLPNIKNFFTTGSAPSSSTSDDQVGTQIAFFNGQQVDFPRLETLEITSLDNLEFMFSSSTVKSFAQLKELSVRYCEKMEAIITEEEGLGMETSETLALPMLTNLSLDGLRSLTCFSRGKCSREAQSQDHVQSHSTALFNREVSIPSLESLTVEGLPKLKEIWSDDSPSELSNLQSLKVVRCESLLKVISIRSLVKLQKLHTLTIQDCVSVQDIFYLDGASGSGNVETVSELTTLELNKMGSLRCIWNKSPCGIVSFHNLKKLKVDHCDNLRFMFFPSTIKSLAQLRNLTVRNCNKIEAIITEEEGLGMETSETLLFPMLTYLSLECLESLMCFSRGKCSREARSQDPVPSCSTVLFNREVALPRLETLKITGLNNLGFMFSPSMVESLAQLKNITVGSCKKMEAIITEGEGLGMETSETLAFPMLTNLHLYKLKSLTCFSREKCSGEAQSEDRAQSCSTALFNREVTFPRLETLEINGMDNLGFVFFPSMIKSLMQLKKLTVSNCKKMEAIITGKERLGMETSETLAFPMLTNLRLDGLKSLTCFSSEKCSQEAQSQDRVQSHSTVLFNREVTFPRLETLEINGLDNFEFMFFPSMLKSLVQLKDLTVSNCEKMEAIIMEGEGLGMETSETLAFPMLINLSLDRLKSLTCFSRGKCSQEGLSQDYIISRSTALFNREVSIPSLESLTVKGLPKLKEIWGDESPLELSNLQSLEVVQCESLLKVISIRSLVKLQKLHTLTIKDCVSVHDIFDLDGASGSGNVETVSELTTLELNEMRSLRCIWNKSPCGIVSFHNLKKLKVDHCDNLKFMFFPSMIKSLAQLRDLTVRNCNKIEAIITEEEGMGMETSKTLLFPMLTDLSLKCLESLTCFFRGKCSQEAQSQDHVQSCSTVFFNQEVALPRLETLEITRLDNLGFMFSPSMVESLTQLKKITVVYCKKMEAIIMEEEGLGMETSGTLAFPMLTDLSLTYLESLTCFSGVKCENGYTLMFPLLEDVIVTGCLHMNFFSKGPIEAPKLKRVRVARDAAAAWFWKENLNITIQNMFEEMDLFVGVKKMLLSELPNLIGKWHSELNPIKSSWQLESLAVDKCPSFIKAIPSKLLLVLDNLHTLQVCNCELLEEILDLEGLEAVESTRVLPRLRVLNLVNLPKLRRLWNKDLQESLPFYSLGVLILYNCSNLGHAFTPSMAQCLAHLWKIEIKECGQMEGVITDEEGQGSAVEKIALPHLEFLKLECLPNLTSFLLGNNHTLECPRLTGLTISHCPKMRSLTWQSLMEIDHGTPSLFTPQVQFPRLKLMVLSHMDSLSKIWTDGPQETRTFDYLGEVEVQNCRSLEYLFPHWVATSLTQLENLRVECCGIEEIVASGDDTPCSNTAQVLFSKLTSLVLHEMPRLKSFYSNLPTLNWPFLKELRVTHCDKVNMLSFAASINKWTQREDQQDLSDQEAHSSFERDFPNLERLLLVYKDVRMIQDGKFPDDIFGKPKALTLACFHDEKAVFPPGFLLERFQNLQSLEVFCSSFEDIFPNDGLTDEGKHPVLENLRELKLSKLHNLKHVWREHYLIAKILRGIKTFEVWDCPCLTTIFPAEISFRNLTKLVVKNSSGLVHLVTASAITNLLHLTWMTIIGCERMKVVVAYDDNGEGKVISLGKLEGLTLQDLPSLECFSSTTSCSLSFPSLYYIKVEECPQMKIFFKGTLSTPQLKYVNLFRYKWDWDWEERDLNTTIQKLSA